MLEPMFCEVEMYCWFGLMVGCTKKSVAEEVVVER